MDLFLTPLYLILVLFSANYSSDGKFRRCWLLKTELLCLFLALFSDNYYIQPVSSK